MYFLLSVVFFLIIGPIVIALQNNMPLELKFISWNLQISFTALIIYSSLIGGAIVAVLALPKLARKALDARSLNKENHKLKGRISDLEKRHVGELTAE